MDKLRTGIKWFIVALEAFLVAALVWHVVYVFNEYGFAYGDEVEGQQVWVLCEPNGCVNLREKPKGAIFGGVCCGDDLLTDGKTKNGWLHVFDLAAEIDSGWISARYIVYDEPETVMRKMQIQAEGRVAARNWVDGKVIHWLHDGEKVEVYYSSYEWSVTDMGYIKTEFLTEVQDDE